MLFGDGGESRWAQLGSQAVEPLEAHDQRPPPAGVDLIGVPGESDVGVYVHDGDADLEGHHIASTLRVIVGQWMYRDEFGLQVDRTLRYRAGPTVSESAGLRPAMPNLSGSKR